jgi:hypothetical protein
VKPSDLRRRRTGGSGGALIGGSKGRAGAEGGVGGQGGQEGGAGGFRFLSCSVQYEKDVKNKI